MSANTFDMTEAKQVLADRKAVVARAKRTLHQLIVQHAPYYFDNSGRPMTLLGLLRVANFRLSARDAVELLNGQKVSAWVPDGELDYENGHTVIPEAGMKFIDEDTKVILHRLLDMFDFDDNRSLLWTDFEEEMYEPNAQ
jgi:hypothetical protein